MSPPQPESLMMCPICIETMTPPILQCQRGHSMCGTCIKDNDLVRCPCCRGPLSDIRNYQLEQLIEGIKDILLLSCCYTAQGCKYKLSKDEKEAHEQECRYRKFQCEGEKFANWTCSWKGNYADLHKHFKDCHSDHTWMEYRTEAKTKIHLERDFSDVQIISFFNGQNYFYYKHKIDTAKQKAYWTFQLIGFKTQANHFFYEFEVFNGPIRKIKVTEVCQNDTTSTDLIFEEEKCVVMSFTTLKNYLDENGELSFKFRIMSIKKTTTAVEAMQKSAVIDTRKQRTGAIPKKIPFPC